MYDRRGRTFLTSLATSLGVGLIFFFLVSANIERSLPDEQVPQRQEELNTLPPIRTQAQEERATSPVIAQVAHFASPGVVGISVLQGDERSLFDPDVSEEWGIGSGVIVSQNGYILTNHHVAGGKNSRIIVSLNDGRSVDGVSVWSDPVIDLAIVKVNLTGLHAIPLGDVHKVQVGEPAIAIGNPLGLELQRTVTSGIVSALNRTIQIETERGLNYMEDLIQTDASINPGNSGGPLLNVRGEVIGINTVKIVGAEGIGFAVPINLAIPVLNQFIENNQFAESYMGVFAYDRDVIPYVDGELKVDNGVYVMHIDENSPAAKAGLKVGCVIKEVDGEEVNTMMDLRCHILSKNPGEALRITHMAEKDGKLETVTVKLSEKNGEQLITR